VVEAVLGRRPGVQEVEANATAQTATVTYDTEKTSVAQLRCRVEECGLHCAGQSVPTHMCDPMQEPDPNGHVGHGPASVIEAPPRHEAHPPQAPSEHEIHDATSAGGLAEGHTGHVMPMEEGRTGSARKRCPHRTR
jgi:Cu2+-exporting ATPase